MTRKWLRLGVSNENRVRVPSHGQKNRSESEFEWLADPWYRERNITHLVQALLLKNRMHTVKVHSPGLWTHAPTKDEWTTWGCFFIFILCLCFLLIKWHDLILFMCRELFSLHFLTSFLPRNDYLCVFLDGAAPQDLHAPAVPGVTVCHTSLTVWHGVTVCHTSPMVWHGVTVWWCVTYDTVDQWEYTSQPCDQ